MKKLSDFEKTQNIVDALHNANTGKQIIDALSHLPCENLLQMLQMIGAILEARHTEDHKFNKEARNDKN